jgi:hypothetical protein
MSTRPALTRLIESWLEEGPRVLPDRVIDAVVADLPATRQRRAGWPARRFPIMNSNAFRYGIAAAVVVLVAIVGYQLLPGGGSGGPPASPTPTVAPTAGATASPSPEPSPVAFPPRGELAIGRQAMTLAGVRLSMDFPSAGWISNGTWGIDKGDFLAPASDSAGFFMWPDGAADNVYSDPCAQTELNPPAGASAAERAAAVAAIPGLELVSPPSAVTVGGQPAQHVVMRVPETIGCTPNRFFLWYDADDPAAGNARHASAPGETLYEWIIEVNGTIVWIDAETPAGSGPEAAREVQQIVDSIQFE